MKIVNSKNFVPQKIFLTKGIGTHKEKLASFELALRDAGIASLNLIKQQEAFFGNQIDNNFELF